jgi:hypothetical protein
VTKPVTSMFAQMKVIESETTSSSAASIGASKTESIADDIASLATNGGSAFGFINNNTITADDTKQHPESFDPLQNTTPQSAQKKMMQMSHEQMQAMAYQQNMWLQQQQQMQQMQLLALGAAAMQGGGGRVVVTPNMMGFSPTGPVLPHAPARPGGFSFVPPAKKDDKKFDFVKDAMSTAKK